MFDYLQQFKRLPKELQDYVSSEEAMKSLDEIEAKHGVKLAAAVMRLMVKDLSLEKLPLFLSSEFSLNEEEAKQITKELKAGVLRKAASHLGFAPVITSDPAEEKINQLLQTNIVSFSSQELINRFRLISKTYLHGVRSKIDTRLVMQKSIDAGGLGLSTEKADQLLNSLDGQELKIDTTKKSSALDNLIKTHTIQPEYSLANSIEERKKKMLAAKNLPAAEEKVNLPLEKAPVKSLPKPDVVPNNLPFAEAEKEEKIAEPDEVAAFLKKISQGQTPEKEEVKPAVKPIPAPVPTPTPTPIPTPIVAAAPALVKKVSEGQFEIKIQSAPKEVKPEINKTPTEKPVIKEPGVSFQPIPTAKLITPQQPVHNYGPKIAPVTASSEQGRVRMDDVRTAPRVMGPVEELRFLDLANFRRLAPTPTEATAKIFSKIKLLEKSGYDRMTAGIAAWRQSEVNRLYLIMCRESAFKAKPILEIMEQLKAAGKNYLTIEEIDAIMLLNAKLIF